MISFNSTNISQQLHDGILVNQHITVQAAFEITGYNIQYLRRILRSGVLQGIKIGQMWLINIESFVVQALGYSLATTEFSYCALPSKAL